MRRLKSQSSASPTTRGPVRPWYGFFTLLLLGLFSASSSLTDLLPHARRTEPNRFQPAHRAGSQPAPYQVTGLQPPSLYTEALLPRSNQPNPTLLQFTPWDLVLALAWSPDGKLLAVSAGEFVHLFDSETLAETRSLETGVWTPALAFDPRSGRLATGSRDGSVRLWDLRSSRPAETIDTHPKGVNSLAYDPGGTLLATSGNDGMVRIWEIASGEIVARLIGGVFAVPAVAFSRDGRQLATADGLNLRLREVETQRLVFTLRGQGSFYTLAYSPDGRRLAAGDSANGVQIWDASNGTLLQALDGHSGNPDRVSGLVWQVAFSPDGRILASAGGDAAVRLWDAASGQALETLTGHRLAVTSLAFSPDGRRLASGSLDATVRVWDMNTGDRGVGE